MEVWRRIRMSSEREGTYGGNDGARIHKAVDIVGAGSNAGRGGDGGGRSLEISGAEAARGIHGARDLSGGEGREGSEAEEDEGGAHGAGEQTKRAIISRNAQSEVSPSWCA